MKNLDHLDSHTIRELSKSRNIKAAHMVMNHPHLRSIDLLDAWDQHLTNLNIFRGTEENKEGWRRAIGNKILNHPNATYRNIRDIADNGGDSFHISHQMLDTYRLQRWDVQRVTENYVDHPRYHEMMRTVKKRYKKNSDYLHDDVPNMTWENSKIEKFPDKR